MSPSVPPITDDIPVRVFDDDPIPCERYGRDRVIASRRRRSTVWAVTCHYLYQSLSPSNIRLPLFAKPTCRYWDLPHACPVKGLNGFCK